MVKLLCAEWHYNRAILVVTGTFCLLLGAAYWLWGGSESRASIRAFRVLVIFCIAVVWLFQILRRQKEGVDRLHRLLPVPQAIVGLFRLLYLACFWIVLMAIFVAARLHSSGPGAAVLLGRDVASFTGIFLTANGLTLVSRDHRYSALDRIWMTVVRITVAFFLIGGYLLFVLHGALVNELGSIFNGVDIVFRSVYYSLPGSLGILAVGLLCSLLSVFVYGKRIDYKE